MRGPERRVDESAAITDQPHVEIMQTGIDRHLLEAAPGDKRADGVYVHDFAFQREAARHADHVLLGNTFHDKTLRHLLSEIIERVDAEVRTDEKNPLVAFGEFIDLIETSFAHY